MLKISIYILFVKFCLYYCLGFYIVVYDLETALENAKLAVVERTELQILFSGPATMIG